MRILLLVERFYFRTNTQCILVTVIPCSSRFVNMCLRQVSLLSPATRDTRHHLVQGGVRCLYGLVGGFLFVW
jgi:hypothetical protein